MSTPEVIETVRSAAQQLLVGLRGIEPLFSTITNELDRLTLVRAYLGFCLERLDALGIRGLDNRLPSSELWNVAGDILQRGWLQNQARTKPRGYAGDYEMLARIYENRLCDDPLGKLFDRYFQEEAAPRAVRNRMAMMTEWIVQCGHLAPRDATGSGHEDRKVAVVGSAFGLEVRDALVQLDEAQRGRLTVMLLDLDWAALEYARQQLAGLIAAERLTTVSANLFRLPKRASLGAHLDNTDLLLCPGLFDYFDDATATAMLRTFWQRLAPGGRLAVFQFAPHNPSRAYMEWLGNWYLIYRTAEQLQHLALDAGIPESQLQLSSEPLGVDLLLIATKAWLAAAADDSS